MPELLLEEDNTNFQDSITRFEQFQQEELFSINDTTTDSEEDSWDSSFC